MRRKICLGVVRAEGGRGKGWERRYGKRSKVEGMGA
jgi:hypothetical protein